jgi:hypothetical protein
MTTDSGCRVPDNDQAMLHLAHGIAAIIADAAVKSGSHQMRIPSDFVEELNSDIAAFQHVNKSASVSIDETDARGVRISRAMDLFVNHFYRSNAAVLVNGKHRHVESAPRRKARSWPSQAEMRITNCIC